MTRKVTLLEDTYVLLAEVWDEQGKRELADELNVGHSWLVKFYHGRIDNPGVATIQWINDLLRERAGLPKFRLEVGR